MPDNQPQVVINNVPAAAAATEAADPTVRYLVEQARAVASAGASATPEMIAKIETEVQGYGQGCFVISGIYGGLSLSILVLGIFLHRRCSDEGMRILIFSVGALTMLACTLLGVHWAQEGALAYFAPLIWVGKQIGGAL